jgi:hypothetical protein
MNRRHLVARIPVVAQTTENVSGIVTGTDRNAIYLRTGTGPVAVKTLPGTRVWKGSDGLDTSVIRTGDDVAIRGVREADGTFVATEISDNSRT